MLNTQPSQPIRLFSAVWGDKHLDWFEKACVNSLAWPKNRAAIPLDSRWTLFSKKDDIKRAAEIASAILPLAQIDFLEMPQSVKGSSPEMGNVLLQGFLLTMKRCLTDGAKLLMAPPDTIFGDGTIPTLLATGKEAHLCVAVAHPRVTPSIFSQFKPSREMSNAELVTAAWKHLHPSWTQAEAGLQQTNSFVGGVSWRKLAHNLVSVTHRLPTVYLADFVPSDLTFFQQPHDGLPPTFGVWDHGWPGHCLIPSQRQRIVGGSDAAFIVELTDEDKNVPPTLNGNPFEPDAFWRSEPHNAHNRQTCVIFRGE